MADFDIPGINHLRSELHTMGANASKKRKLSPMLEPLIRELYEEIRSVIVAGHGFAPIATKIRTTCKVPCSSATVKEIFSRVDREWEKAIGVAALPLSTRKKKEAVK
ncbi:MAG TPA: hypothetical protein DIC53_11645 [Synergistaceae bacterium]|nr:hypothetical protein [Synergistaceae bacterium]